MKTVLKLINFLFVSVNLANGQAPSPIVETPSGLIKGTSDGISREGKQFYQFRGVQYAVVKERFAPSVQPEKWNGTKNATEFGPTCDTIDKHGDENCLYLNIYVNSLPSENSTLKPVVMYIHGGSFKGGASNNFGPNYFMDEDIVFITINYRLGILGFLSTGDANSPGNYGLKDQVMALRWIHNNIEAFSGDKTKITVVGNSAGSASVTYHLVSPMSRGLFQHAIAQSGTFLDSWAHTRKPMRYATKLAEEMNCSDVTNSTAIVQCLRALPAQIIGSRRLTSNVTFKFFEDPIAGFGPTVEPVVGNGSNTFLSSSPFELLVTGNISRVPLMVGNVKEEGIYLWGAYLLFHSSDLAIGERKRLQANWTGVAPGAFYFDEKASSDRLKDIAEKVEEFYFGPGGFSLDNNATFFQLCHLYTDRLFVASSVRFMNLYAKHAPTFPYLYTFNKYVGIEFGWEDLHKNYSLDATHAAELDMLMSPFFGRVRTEPDHDEVSKKVLKLWASFIRNGAPTSTYGSERNFPAINANTGLEKWYRVDEDTELMDNIFSKRIQFWEGLNLSDDDFENCYC